MRMSLAVDCSCDRLFNQFASDGGSFPLDSFIAMVEGLFGQSDSSFSSSTAQLVKLFRTFDLNGDGLIDRDEFGSMWTRWLSIVLHPRSSLIIVDVQNDFISGSLSLDRLQSGLNCASIVPLINSLIDCSSFDAIVYTLDWHPEDHISFVDNVYLRTVTPSVDTRGQSTVNPFDSVSFDIDGVQRQQIVYPRHCVQSTWGSQLHEDLKMVEGALKIYKGTDPNVDSYSAFRDNEGLAWTQMDQQLRERGVTDLYICGIAYDICVYHTVKDALSLNYRTILIEDCSKGTAEDEVARVRQELIGMGCLVVQSHQVESMVAGRVRSWPLAYQFALRLMHPN